VSVVVLYCGDRYCVELETFAVPTIFEKKLGQIFGEGIFENVNFSIKIFTIILLPT